MSGYPEVAEPILNSPFEKPTRYWYIREGEQPQRIEGRRRPAIVFPPRDQKTPWQVDESLLRSSREYPSGFELGLVNLNRERIEMWQKQGYPGVTRTTLELIQWWTREGREKRLFFAQFEAALTIIFLKEARPDFLQGISVPRDEPSDDRKEKEGYSGFERYACKMATGSGKTTVMGMLAAWSILNKLNDRSDARFSDVVLVVCPNVTIRQRLAELNPANEEASIYRTRDLVPAHLIPLLTQGKVLVTNWHVFAPQSMQTGGVTSRVVKAGKEIRVKDTINIGPKTTTARGSRYLSLKDYELQVASGMLKVLEEERENDGSLKRVKVESTRYVESDTALINRVIGREVGGKQNILIMNDEAHHAYRIRREEPDPDEEEDDEEADYFFQEATIWIDGLDKIQKHRGINFCVDLSATPYFLGRVGQETNKPFPWVVSDFGLIDAIESGLVKIPQLAVRDTTGEEIPGYLNIWQWILEKKLTPAERGGKKGSPKPEAILKYAHHPIAMLGGLWEKKTQEWAESGDDPRPPVFILVCKNTKIAKAIYEWLAEDKAPTGIPPARIEGFRNKDGRINSIRVDSKVVHETDTEGAKGDETRWLRATLDTVGKTNWPADKQGRPVYPEGFEELAKKLEKPLHPPGRDVRCIVSVGMLTEGWDCNTVTHIIGLRPFMSQLLCEQVVGRGLRRASYELGENGRFTEEVAKVFGVPFEVIPFKANPTGTPPPRVKKYHVHAIPEKARFEIQFPRVEGYTQAIRNRVTMDWEHTPKLVLQPDLIPPKVDMKGLSISDTGRLSLSGPSPMDEVSLLEYRTNLRVQELVFDLARGLTKEYVSQPGCSVPAHVLFPQLVRIIQKYVAEKVEVRPPADLKDLGLAPYYAWLVEILTENIRPDTAGGEAPEIPRYESSRGPGSTAEVDFWTSREPREVVKSHLNYVVPDTQKWEQAAAYYIDSHAAVDAFVKNAGLGFAIPYLHNGQMHDYVPDFIIRLKTDPPVHLILETKGYDPLEDVKRAAAERWVAAVNAEGSYGRWAYELVKKTTDVPGAITNTATGSPQIIARPVEGKET
jgi:type III restriction enzyme